MTTVLPLKISVERIFIEFDKLFTGSVLLLRALPCHRIFARFSGRAKLEQLLNWIQTYFKYIENTFLRIWKPREFAKRVADIKLNCVDTYLPERLDQL